MKFKNRIKSNIKNSIKPIANKFGFILKSEIKRTDGEVNVKNILLHQFYSTIKQLGFQPKHIVDIGANHGTWTREILKFFPTSQISMFEPQSWLKDSVIDLISTNRNIIFYPYGLADKKGVFKFTLADRDDSCTFIYNEQEAKMKGFEQIDVPVVTLNEFILQEKLPIPNIIKIDSEGLDLKVLKGSNSFFGKTEVFMVEAAVCCKGLENTAIKVINYMDKNGYTLFDITDINKPFKTKVLWLVELVFVKKGGLLEKAVISK